MKKQQNYSFLIILVLVLIVIPFVYYFPRLRTLEPKQIFDLFLVAANLKTLTLTFFLTNVSIFMTSATIDLIAMGWTNSALRRLFLIRNPTARGDLWCWVLTIFSVFDLFALLFSLGFFYVLSSIIVKVGGFAPIQLIPYPLLQFVVVFFFWRSKALFMASIHAYKTLLGAAQVSSFRNGIQSYYKFPWAFY